MDLEGIASFLSAKLNLLGILLQPLVLWYQNKIWQ